MDKASGHYVKSNMFKLSFLNHVNIKGKTSLYFFKQWLLLSRIWGCVHIFSSTLPGNYKIGNGNSQTCQKEYIF